MLVEMFPERGILDKFTARFVLRQVRPVMLLAAVQFEFVVLLPLF